MIVVFVRWLLIVVTNIIYLTDANGITGNLCWSMPCMNGGSCFGSAYTYLCVCPVNYSGALCEKRLGICQESPCGNRGLCIETGVFSFECRCYFDYMGHLCEEHVPKSDASIWSSLIPVHTRVLLDMLQEAYREKAYGRSGPRSNHDRVDFSSSLTTKVPSSSLPYKTTATRKTIKVKSNPTTTRRRETTTTENVIQTDGIQPDNISPETSTSLSFDLSTQSFTTKASPTFETTEQDNDETTISPDIIQTTENIFTTLSPLTTVESMMTLSIEQNQTDYSNTTEDRESFSTTEQYNLTIASASNEWSNYNSDNETSDYTTELTENSTAQISNNTESDDFIIENTTSQTINETSFEPIDDDSSNQTDYNPLSTSETTMASTLTSNNPTLSVNKAIDLLDNSKSAQNQMLLKLCQQLLSHILPNATSLSTSAAIEAALALSSGSSSSDKNSADALLIWIKEQLRSTTSTQPPTTTTTIAMTTTKRKITSTSTRAMPSSSLSALLINEKKISSISLQRVQMDDILNQMNNNNDIEN